MSGFGIVFIDRTEVQLKNAGNLRLITKQAVVDGIVDYWAAKDLIKEVQTSAQTLRIKSRDKSYLIFDNKYYSDSSVNGRRFVLDGATFLTKNNITLVELSNMVAHLKNLIRGVFTNMLVPQQKKATELIALIDKEYHLK